MNSELLLSKKMGETRFALTITEICGNTKCFTKHFFLILFNLFIVPSFFKCDF